MKRREFIAGTAGLLGSAATFSRLNAAVPCPPPALSVEGGATAQTSCAAVGQADWVARSSGPGVVWAHDFKNSSEVSAFLDPTASLKDGNQPRWANDPQEGSCIELMALGGRLTSDFSANATTLSVDDGGDWPDSGFYVIVGTLGTGASERKREMLFVTGRTGPNSFTVNRAVPYDSNFSTTAQDWVVGDAVGQEVLSWRRPFSAFTAPSNGRDASDQGGTGGYAVTKRSWPGRPNGDAGYWGGGYYGHPSYQSASPSFRGISDAWDGDEFWLQFKVKIDPRFFQYHDPNKYGLGDQSNMWAHKLLFIQTVVSVPQQICPQIENPNAYNYQTSPYVQFTDYGRAGYLQKSGVTTQSYLQPGGQFGSTCYATSSSMGQAGNCWEWPSTAEWVTVMYHIRPGRHRTAETVLETKLWRPGYSDWVTVFADNAITLKYGDYQQNYGTFTIEGTGTPITTTMPGYNALNIAQYLNAILGYKAVPVHSHYKRFTQVIFSRSEIPRPVA